MGAIASQIERALFYTFRLKTEIHMSGEGAYGKTKIPAELANFPEASGVSETRKVLEKLRCKKAHNSGSELSRLLRQPTTICVHPGARAI